MRRSTVALCSLGVLWPTLVFGQVIKAGVVTNVEGIVTAARLTSSTPVPLRFKDDVFVKDKITTAENSLVRVLLGGKAVITVRERSAVTITEVPGLSTIDLQSGAVRLSVAKDRMRSGEAIELRTPNAIGAIRGTVVVAEAAVPNGNLAGATSTLHLLQGKVEVTQLNPLTGAPLGGPVMLAVMQSISAAGTAPARVTPIVPTQVDQITRGFEPKAPSQPEGANKQEVKALAMETARALVADLTGPSANEPMPATVAGAKSAEQPQEKRTDQDKPADTSSPRRADTSNERVGQASDDKGREDAPKSRRFSFAPGHSAQPGQPQGQQVAPAAGQPPKTFSGASLANTGSPASATAGSTLAKGGVDVRIQVNELPGAALATPSLAGENSFTEAGSLLKQGKRIDRPWLQLREAERGRRR